MIRMLALLAMAGLVTGQAYADCTGPNGSAGALIYATNISTAVYCDGTHWVSLAGQPTPPTIALREIVVTNVSASGLSATGHEVCDKKHANSLRVNPDTHLVQICRP